MADVSYRFAGIPDGIEASVFAADDLETEVTTVTGAQVGYVDTTLPVGDYIATWTSGGAEHSTSGDLASPTDVDYSRSALSADAVAFDNTTSDLTASDVQAALDELTARIVDLETP